MTMDDDQLAQMRAKMEASQREVGVNNTPTPDIPVPAPEGEAPVNPSPEESARAAHRRFNELDAYVSAEVDRLNSEVASLNLGFNLTCVCIIALTVLVYLIDKKDE